jgi:hypothetical protein
MTIYARTSQKTQFKTIILGVVLDFEKHIVGKYKMDYKTDYKISQDARFSSSFPSSNKYI